MVSFFHEVEAEIAVKEKSMEAEKEVCTLRDVIEHCDNQDWKEIFRRKLDQVESLANSLFQRDDSVPLPYFTPHDATHCKAVENYLSQIIWGTEGQRVILSEYDFVPTGRGNVFAFCCLVA